MSLSATMISALQQYSHGQTAYIRVSTVTGGNAALKITGTVTYIDYLLTHIPVRYRISDSEVLDEEIKLGDFKVILFFGNEFNESIAGTMTELIVGGTYNVNTRKVTGGTVHRILRSSIVKLYMDSNTACGVEFIAGIRG